MKSEKLYVVGIGPGDPELITLKAHRILTNTKCIIVPKGKEEGSSLALSIASGAINMAGKEVVEVHFPMAKRDIQGQQDIFDRKWDMAVDAILIAIRNYSTVAFITLGDPSLYCTFFYIYHRLLSMQPSLEIEIIPGISSVNAASACALIPLTLGDEKLAIVPATYSDKRLSDIIENFETIILMKTHRVFDKIVSLLTLKGLLNNSIYISQIGMETQKIIRNLNDVKPIDLNYFSLIIIKKTLIYD